MGVLSLPSPLRISANFSEFTDGLNDLSFLLNLIGNTLPPLNHSLWPFCSVEILMNVGSLDRSIRSPGTRELNRKDWGDINQEQKHIQILCVP